MRKLGAALSAAVIAGLVAGCGGTGIGSVANVGHDGTHGRFASGSASGDYAVAQAAGTAYDPKDLEVYVDASQPQQASITYATVCVENSGGAGSKEQQKTSTTVPAVVHVKYPSGSVNCILSANSQLSQGGTVKVELFNGGAPHVSTPVVGQTTTSPDLLKTDTGAGVVSSTGTAASCSSEKVDLGLSGTWTLAGNGVSCATANSVLNRYEHSQLRADGTTQSLGAWKCRLTRFVSFKADTNNGYEGWRCWQAGEWVTFFTGNPALANKPGSATSGAAPAGFSSSGAGPSGTVPGGSYSGIAKVGGWGPTPMQTSCPGDSSFSIDEGSPAGTCAFAQSAFTLITEVFKATGHYPAKVISTGSPAYTATCTGGGNAGSITEPPIELSCNDVTASDPAKNVYVQVNISLPIIASQSTTTSPGSTQTLTQRTAGGVAHTNDRSCYHSEDLTDGTPCYGITNDPACQQGTDPGTGADCTSPGQSEAAAQAEYASGSASDGGSAPTALKHECDGEDLWASTGVTCGFATRVLDSVQFAYINGENPIPANITAWSPTTKQTYSLTCQTVNHGYEVLCTIAGEPSSQVEMDKQMLEAN